MIKKLKNLKKILVSNNTNRNKVKIILNRTLQVLHLEKQGKYAFFQLRRVYKKILSYFRDLEYIKLVVVNKKNSQIKLSQDRKIKLDRIISQSNWLDQGQSSYISLFSPETMTKNKLNIFQREPILDDGTNLSIIIVSYKRLRVLIRLLESIPETFHGEILVLSQGNTQNYNEILKLWTRFGRNIRIIESSRNLGAGAGRNLLVKQCKNNWIMSLDSDMILTELNLVKLGNHVGTSGAKFFSLPFRSPKETNSNNGSSYIFENIDSKTYVKWSNGAKLDHQIIRKHSIICFAMPGGASLFYRPAFDLIGGFNETIGTFEDLDLSFRIQQQGMYVEILKETFLIHAHDSLDSELRDYELENSEIEKYSQAESHFVKNYGVYIVTHELLEWLEKRKKQF